jgi:regulator of protease activity HflC (stomatin/prohibitin superfamily)
MIAIVLAALAALILIGLALSVRILKQYERGVQYR